MILITGAAGKTGKAVLRSLVARGAEVRGFVHRLEQAETLYSLGARETIAGSYFDPAAISKAFQGVEAVYHICPNVNPDELAIGKIVLDAAKNVGVKHFVYHSVLHPQTQAMPHHWQKLLVEEHILEAGIPYTILQPAAYMQNVLAQWDRVADTGVYTVPYRISSRLSMVDLQDVAEAAAIVLTDLGHESAIYELSGSEAPTQSEVAEIWGKAIRRTVSAEETPLDVWENRSRAAGMDEYSLKTLLQMFRYYDRFGFCGNPHVLHMLIGRETVRFADFITREAEERIRAQTN